MSRREYLALVRRAVDAEVRRRTAGTVGAELDREPYHSGCSLHAEVVMHSPPWTGCAEDETLHSERLVRLGAVLAVVPLPGGGPPLPSEMWGRKRSA